jgi:hypothetical protein
MRKTIALLPCVLLSTTLAQSESYGTQVDSAWYDRLANEYQNPVIAPRYGSEEFNTLGDNTEPKYPNLFKPLVFFVYSKKSDDGKGVMVINPTPDQIKAQNLNYVNDARCALLAEAAMSERIIRNTVDNLENVVGNDNLKATVLALADQDKVYLEYADTRYTKSDQVQNVVAVANGTRIAADKISLQNTVVNVSGSYISYKLEFQAEFSLKRLKETGAIQGDKITFQHGWQKSSFCTFDLTKLP